MLFETKNLRVFIYKEMIDMRCGFEKLHYFTKEIMKQDINQGHVYLFFGKNRKRLKVLFYDGTGLVLITKRIERGRLHRRPQLLQTRWGGHRQACRLHCLLGFSVGNILRRCQRRLDVVSRSLWVGSLPPRVHEGAGHQ